MKSVVLVLALFFAAPVSAEVITVRAGGDLQAAINAAKPGDEIALEAGAKFTGPYRLPAKPSGAVITIRSSAVLPSLRISPADAALLPTIVSGTVEAALFVENTANWRIDGVQFGANVSGEGNVIHIQDSVNIYLDRILIVAPAAGQKRGVMGNGRQITLTRSHIAGIWRSGQDSQAFCAWDGAGPYTVTDNYLEAASENVMFGGANSQSAAHIPSDVLVEGNHMTKPLAWKGTPKAVKNLFELKSAKRVIVRNNVFENNWTDAQDGYAILITGRNDEGQSPWSEVSDVLFEKNIVRNTENGVNVLGYDSYKPSGRTTRITVRDNDIDAAWKGFKVGSEVGELAVVRNRITLAHGEDSYLATMYLGDVWSAAEGLSAPRPAKFAVASLAWTGNVSNVVQIHGGENIGTLVEDGVPLAIKRLTLAYTLISETPPGATTPPPPVVTPPPVPVVQTPLQRIEAAIALLKGVEQQQLTSKGVVNIRNILTRLLTLKGQVQ